MTGIWLWITAAVMTYVAGPERVSATVVPDNLEVKDGRPEDETSYRDLETFPADLSVCDSYFFGHQAVLSPDKLPFCVNNGICKASWVNDPSQPCECSNAYAGPHCEFVAGQVPSTCHLGCRNGGTCKIGASSWQKYYRGKGGWTNPFDLQHCECPTGYTGLLCENAGTPCGDDSCRNGGSCIISSNPDGSNKYFCDCTTAISSDGVKKYAGQYCENEATSFCPQPTVDGRQFCVNGGTCRSDSNPGCNCQTGFVGPVCEFKDLGNATVDCGLTCSNHGICRKGAGQDAGIWTKYGLENSTQQAASNHDSIEHCVCPTGYVGLQCEFQLDQCPGGTHACLNGGQCVTSPDGDKISYACDCTNAESTKSRFAGVYCEMESTQFCTLDGSKSRNGVGLDSFCTNGGKCRKLVPYFEKHPGCDCLAGFEGENCQYVTVESKTGPNTVAIVAGILVGASIFSLCALLFLKRRRSKTQMYANVESPLPPTLDIIRSLGHDREAEFTAVPSNAMVLSSKSRSTSVSVQNTEDLVIMRRTYWPNSGVYDASKPSNIFNDVDLDEQVVRSTRRVYWPNDARHDATNPIHVFDDISVRSEELESSTSGTDSGGSLSSDDHQGIV